MFTLHSKVNYLLKITAVFWIVTKLLSYKLWLSNRLFPVLPVFDFLDNFPNGFHLFLFIVGMGLMVLVLLQPITKKIIGLTLLVEVISCLLDQTRWQPYEYHCLLVYCFYFFLKEQKHFINCFIFLMVATYAYSGLHKLNGGFLFFIWEKSILIKFFGFRMDQIQNTAVHYLGLTLGLFEVVCALFLLVSKHKKIFAGLLIVMHLFIIVWLSPLGTNHNFIVLPWNIAMVLFLMVLFFTNEKTNFSFKELFEARQIVFFILIGILPMLNFLNLFDDYLSFKLYSGNLPKMFICIENRAKAKQFNAYFSENKTILDCPNTIAISNWSLKEINVFSYPSERVNIKIMKKWKEQHPDILAKFYLVKYPYHKENIQLLGE